MAYTLGGASAEDILRSTLEQYGLGELAGWLWGEVSAGTPQEEVYLKMVEQPAYQARFPAMAELRKEGRAISEAEYIGYERGLRQIEQQYGLTRGIVSDSTTVAKSLLADVSVREMEERARIAQSAAYQAPVEVRDALSSMYGVDMGGMTSYFLDADRALPLIEQQYAAAQIAGAASLRLVGVEREQAERLAAQGVNYEEALQGFSAVAQTERLGSGSGETVGQSVRTAAQFGDAAARQAVTRVQQSRRAVFGGGGSAAETQQGVVGLGSSVS